MTEQSVEKNGVIPQANVPNSYELECPSCHGESFNVMDTKTGLLRCNYCRNQWINEHFVEITETERFLREQAKQPKVIIDNTSDTDRQLMGMFAGLFGIPRLLASLLNGLKTFAIIVVVVLVLVVAGILAFRYLG